MCFFVCVSHMCGLVCCLGCISAFVYVGVGSVFTCVSERLCVSASALKCCVVSSCAYSCVRLLWGVLERFDLTGTCSGSSESTSPFHLLAESASTPWDKCFLPTQALHTSRAPFLRRTRIWPSTTSCVVELSSCMLCTPYKGDPRSPS